MHPLHIVNKSPYASSALDSCLIRLTDEASLLLIEDAVCAALAGGAWSARLADTVGTNAVYALGPDLAARGLIDRELVNGITVVDYGGFVDLAARHSVAQSWF
jgi:tRNA 2-thiouridine synthesizing protein B